MMNFEIWKHISVNFTFTFKHFMQKRSQYYRCWLAVRFKRNSKVQTFKVKLIIDNQTHIKYILFVLVFSSPVYSDYHFGRSWAGWQHIQHCRALKVETLWSLKCLSGNWQAWGQNPIQIPNPRTWAVTKISYTTPHSSLHPDHDFYLGGVTDKIQTVKSWLPDHTKLAAFDF